MTEKDVISITEYCRRSRWDLKPARIRGWCRNGFGGETPPFRKIGARYFLDAPVFDAWLWRISRGGQRTEVDAADYIAEIVARNDSQGGKE